MGFQANSQRSEQYPFAKAMGGGGAIDEQQIRQATREQLAAMKARLVLPPVEKSGNQLNLRLAEELDYSRRLLEQVEAELRHRDCRGPNDRHMLAQIEAAEDIIHNVSNIVEAKNQCEAVQRSRSSEVRKRLLRRNIDGSEAVCAGPSSSAQG